MAVNGNSLATDRCTVPTECLDSSGGQTFGFRSAGYETCAPFLDVPVTVQDGVLRSHDLGVGVRRRVPGLRARFINSALLLLRALIDADAGSECRTVPRRRKCHPQGRRHYPRCHQQKRRRARAIHALAGTLSGADARAPDAVVDAVARPFISAFTNPDAAAHGKLRADASAHHNTLVIALSGALSSTIDELRPDNRRPAIIKTDADADADPVAGALDGRADGGLPDGVPARRRRHE